MRKKRLLTQGVSFGGLMIAIVLGVLSPLPAFGVTLEELDKDIKKRETSFYREFFDRILYEPFAHLLRFDQLADDVTREKHEALDINPFDEVPDSGFFVNRHGKEHLSRGSLEKGPSQGAGPDPSGSWRVLKGKTEGVTAGFLIEDEKGDRYLLKFDPKDNPEMTTSAEIIAHKFFYAFGYHVAEYYLVRFDPKILTPDAKATYYNEDGFKKPLTQEALEELLEKVPKLKGGLVRASASKILRNHKGYMDFEGHRSSDPDDLILHEDRRSLRALRVFGSWLNHYDLREGNTLDVIELEDGKPILKHYLIDFGSTLGSASSHPKVPAAGYEHIVDWFEVGKTAPTLKVVEKPWEKKWDSLNREIPYPELGYFDNAEFDPREWKTQLPYEVFRRLTRGDAFWAAKIIMSFSDEDVRSIVETAEFSDPENTKILSEILNARRDIIGRYWFSRATPLDQIRLFKIDEVTYQIRFADLSVQHGFAKQEESQYRAKVMAKKQGESGHQEFEAPSFSFIVPPLGGGEEMTLFVQARRGSKEGWSEPPLKIVLAKRTEDAPLTIVEIDHGI
ncbi:MAG: hypothetical protein HY584_04250 [Candidatus Omnitrophica bacterium]|nr:hypothetical protein [Candidatus Omnitrophota bacterium]